MPTIVDLISIVACNLCVTLPADQIVSELPLPEAWGRLATVLVRRDWSEPWSPELTRYPSALDIGIEQVRVCRACGTHYHYRQSHDPHFGEPRAPETDWHLQRLTPTEARVHYIDQTFPSGEVQPLDGGWLAQRYETIIGLLRRDLPHSPNWQIERYIVNSLYMHYVYDQDWEGLRAALLDYPDPAVGVYVADRIFAALDPKNPARAWAPSSFKYWDHLSALLAAEPTREAQLVAVLAGGLSASGRIMNLFLYPTRWEPVPVAGYAMNTLQTYVPRQSLAPAIPALAAVLQLPGSTVRRREAARDLLIEYVGAASERAKEVLGALTGDNDEALAIRTHCQRCLAQSADPIRKG
ncbi:MAG: hypothetical protein Fur0022_07420 [Anaerolineales bacterium]